MHPSMLTELLRSYHREQVEHHQKQARMRRREIHDRAWIDADGTRLVVVVDRPGTLLTKLAGWIGRMRPVRAG